jgi:hypothetical protein
VSPVGVFQLAFVLLDSSISPRREKLMSRFFRITWVALGVLSIVATAGAQSPSIGRPNFSGAWTLNRDLSDASAQRDSGAAVSHKESARSDPPTVPPSEFDRAVGRGPLPSSRSASINEVDQLIGELKDRSPSLTISHADQVLTVTDARERTRLYRTNGQRDPHQVGAATVLSTTRWDGDRLVTDYDLGAGRRIRIAYSLIPPTRQLVEQVTFANGQTIKRVYDQARPIRRR